MVLSFHLACFQIMWITVVLILLNLVCSPSGVSAQYDFYRSLGDLMSEPSKKSDMNHRGSNTAAMGSNVNIGRESSILKGVTVTPSIESKGTDFDVMDINAWDYIPNEFFASDIPASTITPITGNHDQPGLTVNGQSSKDPALSTSTGYVTTSLSENTGWTDTHNKETSSVQNELHGNVEGHSNHGDVVEPMAIDSMFLPLADHMAGASLSMNPDQMHDWSALPLSEDTHKYTDPPTLTRTPKPDLSNGQSFARAILLGEIKRWEWSYVSAVLEGEARFSNLSHGSSDWISCCQRLPYICSMDAVCQLEAKRCHDFCECAAHPAMPHCVTVIPEIKRVMARLEREMLTRIARELNMPPPPETVTKIPEWSYITESSPTKSANLPKTIEATINSNAESARSTQLDIATKSFETMTTSTTQISNGDFTTQSLSTYQLSTSNMVSSSPTAVTTSRTSLFPSPLTTQLIDVHKEDLAQTSASRPPSTTTPALKMTQTTVINPSNLVFQSSFPRTTSKSIATRSSANSIITTTSARDLTKPTTPLNSATPKTRGTTKLSFNMDMAVTNMSSPKVKSRPINESNSNLVNNKKQDSLFSWFRSLNNYTIQPTSRSPTRALDPKDSPSNQSSSEREDELNSTISTFTVTNSSTEGQSFEFCSNDCEVKGGTCVMGRDFRPHCIIVAPDACEHFYCVHGECVSDDGVYTCECSSGWAGTFCDIHCPLDCGQYGYCAVVGAREGPSAESGHNSNDSSSNSNSNNSNITADIACVCQWNRTGSNCEDTRRIVPTIYELEVPPDDFHAWQVALVSILSAITLALLCMLTTYFLWRRSWLPMRKLVYYFQEYEDDDDKDYDAYVSFKSSPRDERFVLQHLYPKLEQELGFRLCLHFRDFPPGEAIANNIIHAVERSRRTILVLSPNYVSSEWCRLEYQKAQQEMLKLRHKIIPVVLEDVRKVPGVDKTLHTIMDTVTYIEWPGESKHTVSKGAGRGISGDTKQADVDHFWKLLACSMPKKKKSSCANGYTRSLSRTSDDVALTAVGQAAMSAAAPSRPKLATPRSCFTSVVDALSIMDDIRDHSDKSKETCCEEGFTSFSSLNRPSAGHHTGNNNSSSNNMNIYKNISSNGTGFSIINCSDSPYNNTTNSSSIDICQGQSEESVSPGTDFPGRLHVYKGRTVDIASVDKVCSARGTRTLQNHMPFIREQTQTPIVSSKQIHSQSVESSRKDKNSTHYLNTSKNYLTGYKEKHISDTIGSYQGQIPIPCRDSGIETSEDDNLAAKSLTDSGVHSSTEGSSCSSNSSRSSTGESMGSHPRLYAKGPKEQRQPGKRDHISSDDHIVEIRNICGKVVITPRPRTLMNHCNK